MKHHMEKIAASNMTTNWIRHPFSETVGKLEAADKITVSEAQTGEFHERVRLLCLLRSTLPEEVKASLRSAEAFQFFAILRNAVVSSRLPDASAAASDYAHAIDVTSRQMGGCPKICQKNVRTLKKCADRMPKTPWKPTKDYFDFLGLPRDVRMRIYRLLLYRGNICVVDWLYEKDLEAVVERRTEHKLSVDGADQRATYMVRCELPNRKDSRIHVDIMAANRQTYAEASEVFYGENCFRFLGTCDAALSFVHDRANQLATLRSVSIQFRTRRAMHFLGCVDVTSYVPLAPRTTEAAWRHLINAFVHMGTGLEEFQLCIDGGIWRLIPWEGGAKGVYEMESLCGLQSLDKQKRNFLQHCARLAGVNFRLQIDDVDRHPQRELFRQQLESLITLQKFRRPYLADDAVPNCYCQRRFLYESCIWDRDLRSMHIH